MSQTPRALTGVRMGMIGLLLLLPTFFLWLGRDAIPSLATTRSLGTAIVYLEHDGTEVQLRRAFAAANKSGHFEAALDPVPKSAAHDRFYLAVAADTSERAQADLEAFTKALTAAFPSGENNLMVSPSNSTRPAPNTASRRIALGVRVAVVLLMLTAQVLIVVGAHWEGMGRAGIFGSLATPFTMFIFPTDGGSRSGSYMTGQSYTDWTFVLVLVAVTPLSILLGLWLSRGSRRAAGRHRRA